MSLINSLRRSILWLLLIAILGLLSLSLYYLIPVLPNPESDYLPRKGNLIDAKVTRSWRAYSNEFQEISLTSDSGLKVDISIRRPGNSPRPVVFILGGYGTGRTAIELIHSEQNMVVVSLSYPYEGTRDVSGLGLLKNIPHIQQSELDVTPAILLTLDYLLQQDYVDKNQVELVGVSLGAFYIAPAAVLDKRVSRVWFVQGAGDPERFFAYVLKKNFESEWVRKRLATLIALIGNVHHLAPEHWIKRISPRPVIVINSRGDPTFPIESVLALHNSLGDPNEIIWLDGGHVKPSEAGIIKQLTDIVLERIEKGIN